MWRKKQLPGKDLSKPKIGYKISVVLIFTGYSGVIAMADSKNAELEKYIAAHVDEAIEQGWIKVYFQPVVRALTGR